MIVNFETPNGKFGFCLAPELAFYVDITLEGVCYVETKDNRVVSIDTNGLKVESADFVKDLTEKDWSKIVEETYDYQPTHDAYISYLDDKKCFSNATESGKSLMESLEIYIENPYGNTSHERDWDMLETWTKAQEKTGNWLLIKYL